jgi:signal transduction histidine kinase/ligand-binding sensor domain-containing protein
MVTAAFSEASVMTSHRHRDHDGFAAVRIAFSWLKSCDVLCVCVRSAFFGLLGAAVVSAQPHTLEVSQYQHTSWTSQEGFFRAGISAINSIAQTPDGYLWVAGTGGVFRFDGVRFSEWKPPANGHLPRSPFHRLLASRDGSLWIAGIGLAELKPNGEARPHHELDGVEIRGLIEDKDGGVWAGGRGVPNHSALCRFYHNSSDCFPTEGPLGQRVGALHEDRNGQLWICTVNGVWRLRPGPPEKFAVISKMDAALSFEEDASGTLSFADGDNLNMVTADRRVVKYPIEPILARTLLKDREGDLWVGTTGQGIVHIHGRQTDRFTTFDGLSSNSIIEIFQDREGNLWAGTSRGLDKFTRPAVPSITSKQGLSGDYVNSILLDHQGVPWIGTRTGLYRFVDGHWIRPTPKLPNTFITSLFQASGGRIIVASDADNGIVHFDGARALPFDATNGDIFGMTEDNRGDLWVASHALGLLHLSGTGHLIESFDKKMIGQLNIAVAFDPRREGLWLTSNLGEIGFFKDGKVVERYGTKDGLAEGIVRDPQADNDGGVWVATRSGLAHLKNGKISVMNRKNGLPCDAVHWMRRDRDHNVWLYMECGLVAFSETELSSWLNDASRTVAIVHYLDNTDGVESVAYNGWYTPQTATTSDGRILFATSTGLSVLNPGNLAQNPLPPPVHIEGIAADEHEIEGANRISLPAKVRSIHIAFTALSFSAPRKVRFRFKLEPYDADWSAPVSRREATYTNLPPGEYDFRVIASNNTGVWNMKGDTLRLVITPAFYQTAWFRVLSASVVAGLAWTLYLIRLKQATARVHNRLLAHMEERERIARELHDTLLQGFQGITLRMQGVAKTMPELDRARRMIEEVLDRADGVLREARVRVRNLRRRATDESELAERLTRRGEELSRDHVSSFTLAVVGTPKVLDPTIQEEAYSIANEALTNAFRHASASKIEVELGYDPSALRIRVRDNGVGIDKTVQSQGQPGHWGLMGMRERAREIRSELSVWSRDAAGTEVELVVPASIAFPRQEPEVS